MNTIQNPEHQDSSITEMEIFIGDNYSFLKSDPVGYYSIFNVPYKPSGSEHHLD